MSSPELLQLTASEPLSIEEEYEMQSACGAFDPWDCANAPSTIETWQHDEDSERLSGAVLVLTTTR